MTGVRTASPDVARGRGRLTPDRRVGRPRSPLRSSRGHTPRHTTWPVPVSGRPRRPLRPIRWEGFTVPHRTAPHHTPSRPVRSRPLEAASEGRHVPDRLTPDTTRTASPAGHVVDAAPGGGRSVGAPSQDGPVPRRWQVRPSVRPSVQPSPVVRTRSGPAIDAERHAFVGTYVTCV